MVSSLMVAQTCDSLANLCMYRLVGRGIKWEERGVPCKLHPGAVILGLINSMLCVDIASSTYLLCILDQIAHEYVFIYMGVFMYYGFLPLV